MSTNVKSGAFPQYFMADMRTNISRYDNDVADLAKDYNYLMAYTMGTQPGFSYMPNDFTKAFQLIVMPEDKFPTCVGMTCVGNIFLCLNKHKLKSLSDRKARRFYGSFEQVDAVVDGARDECQSQWVR